MTLNINSIIRYLEANSNPDDIPFMAKFGITPDRTFGTKIPVLRALAKEIGPDHKLAFKLWDKGYRETMILATMVADPNLVTKKMMDNWSLKFTYWEICDQAVMNLFGRTEYAWDKAVDWSTARHEGRKRAAFVLMARLAVTEKNAKNTSFEKFFPMIVKGALDNRNMVKKAVSWALRQIGKRNIVLNKKSQKIAEALSRLDLPSAKWISTDVLKELTDKKILDRIERKEK